MSLAPGALISWMILLPDWLIWYVIWYPPRTVVFPAPNQGTCHAKPTAGPKLFQSFGYQGVLGFGEPLPTNWSVVGSERCPGLIQPSQLRPEIPNMALPPPTGSGIKPFDSQGTEKYAQRAPIFSVRLLRTFQSSFTKMLDSF